MRDVPAGPEEAAARQPALARYKVTEATDGTQFRKKARQLIQQQRLWADLLSSQPTCFNLFGELAADLELAGGGRPWRPTAPVGPHCHRRDRRRAPAAGGRSTQPTMTPARTPSPLAGRSLRAPVLWGIVFGAIQAAAPLGFWWLDPAAVYALSLT